MPEYDVFLSHNRADRPVVEDLARRLQEFAGPAPEPAAPHRQRDRIDMPLDIESLLAPISEEAPCGEDLTYDQAYMELERIAQGDFAPQLAYCPRCHEFRAICPYAAGTTD